MSDPTKRDDAQSDPTTGLPDELPGGPDEQAGHRDPLVEDDDLDANDKG